MPESPEDLLRHPVVAVDIEVAGLEWEEVDEATRHYLLARFPDQEGRESIRNRLALVRGLGRVVAIGVWNVDQDAGAVLAHGSGNRWQEFEPWPGTRVWRGNEREILEQFWGWCTKWGTIVTYNGRSYDGPVLMTRSAMLGIAPTRMLAGYRYSLREHCDLMEVLHFQGRRGRPTASTTGAGVSASSRRRARWTAPRSPRRPARAATTRSPSTVCGIPGPPRTSSAGSRPP